MVDEPVFNMRQMLEATCDDRELAAQIAEAFVVDTPKQLDGLEAAVACNDARTAERIAHTIKGASATVGGEGLQGVAFECEKLGREGKLDEMRSLIPRLREQYWLLHDAMRHEGLLGG